MIIEIIVIGIIARTVIKEIGEYCNDINPYRSDIGTINEEENDG